MPRMKGCERPCNTSKTVRRKVAGTTGLGKGSPVEGSWNDGSWLPRGDVADVRGVCWAKPDVLEY